MRFQRDINPIRIDNDDRGKSIAEKMIVRRYLKRSDRLVGR